MTLTLRADGTHSAEVLPPEALYFTLPTLDEVLARCGFEVARQGTSCAQAACPFRGRAVTGAVL